MSIFTNAGGWIGGAFGGAFGGPAGAAIGASAGASIGSGIDYFVNKHDSREAASRANKYLLYQQNTAHQREVADLKAAGLNPILSAMGSGAGASIVPVNGSYNRDYNTASELEGYASARRTHEQAERERELHAKALELQDAQIKLINSQTASSSGDAERKMLENLKLSSDINLELSGSPLAGWLKPDYLRGINNSLGFLESLPDKFDSLINGPTTYLGAKNIFRERHENEQLKDILEATSEKYSEVQREELHKLIKARLDGEQDKRYQSPTYRHKRYQQRGLNSAQIEYLEHNPRKAVDWLLHRIKTEDIPVSPKYLRHQQSVLPAYKEVN